MNIKRIAALAAASALLAGGNALAATTKTGTVTVKWNTQVTATLVLHTDYNAAGTFGATAGAILTQANGGAGTCTATDPTNLDLTDDFGNVSPDGGTAYTDCLYKNAVNAIVTTNSTNWNLAAKATAGYVAANGTLCAYTNGAVPTAAASLTARAAAVTVTAAGTCTGGGLLLDGTGSTLATSTSAAAAANVGMDLELILPPNAPSGATTVTETYTLTAN